VVVSDRERGTLSHFGRRGVDLHVADPNGCVHTVTTQNGATVLALVWGRTEPV